VCVCVRVNEFIFASSSIPGRDIRSTYVWMCVGITSLLPSTCMSKTEALLLLPSMGNSCHLSMLSLEDYQCLTHKFPASGVLSVFGVRGGLEDSSPCPAASLDWS